MHKIIGTLLLASALATVHEEPGRSGALLYMDLDQFKVVMTNMKGEPVMPTDDEFNQAADSP